MNITRIDCNSGHDFSEQSTLFIRSYTVSLLSPGNALYCLHIQRLNSDLGKI